MFRKFFCKNTKILKIILIFAENFKTINLMLDKERGLYIAHCADGALSIEGKMANRHGLIAGATGTGKTVTLQVIAETFCQAGVPCFMADMKGR